MGKFIVLILGLAVGAAGGVWYGGHHPWAAQAEERGAIQTKLHLAEAAKGQLDKQIAAQKASPSDHHIVDLATLQHLDDEQKSDILAYQSALGMPPTP